MRVIGRALSLMLVGLAMLGLGCKDIVQAPSGLSYATNPATYLRGVAITPNSPTQSGGKVDAYAVTPALPAGLSLDPASGVLSGTPTATAATATYTVTASNSAGSATASLSLAVVDPVTITTQPADQTISVGQVATFSVVATGSGTLSYQWYRDGVALTGANLASYTTPVAAPADNGSTYNVGVSDAFGSNAKSTSAILTVTASGPGTFTATSGTMGSVRQFHTATLLLTGQVLIVGGADTANTALASAELFDPATGLFTAVGSLAVARQFHTATLLTDGRVLITGGVALNTTLSAAELYDPITKTFSSAGTLQVARAHHTATRLADGKVLLVSGQSGLGTYSRTAEVYTPAAGGAGTFALTTGLPVASRGYHTATLLGSGKVLVAGGESGASSFATAELYDPATGTFTATTGMAVARSKHTATQLGTGKVLLVGGGSAAAAEVFDPTTGAFAPTGSLVTARYHHTASLLPSGKVLIAGGHDSLTSILFSAELFDPTTGTFALTGGMGSPRETHTATTLGTGKVLLAGGTNFGALSSAELYY